MKTWSGIIIFALAITLVLMAVWCFTVGAQMVAPQACGDSLVCLRHRVKDLQDYREFVDDQLALAKALNESLGAQLAACRAVPELPPRTEPAKP